MWKSKFLASTVIVDELRRRLGAVLAREQEVEIAARRVLHQASQLRERVGQVQVAVDTINKAFDPLSKVGRGGCVKV